MVGDGASGFLMLAAPLESLMAEGSVTDGAWHHIAISRSGNTWKMFTDGQLTKTVTNSNPIPALDGPLNLARGYNTAYGCYSRSSFVQRRSQVHLQLHATKGDPGLIVTAKII